MSYGYGPEMYTPIPSSTPNRLVFPLQKGTFKFEINPMAVQMTGGRMTQQEVDRFFEYIQAPVDEFLDKFKFVRSCGFIVILIISALILPLYFFMLCYIMSVQKNAIKESAKCREKIQEIAREQNVYLSDRGLMWVVPAQAPRWVELWITPVGQSVHQAGFQVGMTQPPGGANIPTKIYPQTPQQESQPLVYSYPGFSQQGQAHFQQHQQQMIFQQNQYGQNMYGPGGTFK